MYLMAARVPKFINIALASDPQPSLVAVDTIMRIRPGTANSSITGRDVQCTIFMRQNADTEYDDGKVLRETEIVEVFLPVREIIRRMREETFEV